MFEGKEIKIVGGRRELADRNVIVGVYHPNVGITLLDSETAEEVLCFEFRGMPEKHKDLFTAGISKGEINVGYGAVDKEVGGSKYTETCAFSTKTSAELRELMSEPIKAEKEALIWERKN